MLAVSCNSKSGHLVAAAKSDSTAAPPKPIINTIQVIHPDGMVENIKDEKLIRPNIGDTLVICDIWMESSIKSTPSYSSRFIWGKYTSRMPDNHYSDSSIIEYYPVRVIKRSTQ